jgi:hypothetical protein
MKHFKKLMELIDPDSNYKLYRTTVKQAAPPALPWLGLTLSDLTFIEVGNPDCEDSQKQLSHSIESVLKFQKLPYRTSSLNPQTEQMDALFQELPHEDYESLYELSLYLEPRTAPKADRTSLRIPRKASAH